MAIYVNGQDRTGAVVDLTTKTGDYTVTTADFGKSLRMNSGSDYNFTLPSVGTADDGARLTFIKQGAGKVTITAVDSDLISDSGAAGTISCAAGGLVGADINLEYVHGSVTWVVRGAHGTWTTT